MLSYIGKKWSRQYTINMGILQRIGSWIRPFVHIPATGLDISDRAIKYLKLGAGDPFSVDAYGELEIPEGAISEGDIKNADAVSAILSSWYRREKHTLKTRFVSASLPEQKGFVRLVQLSKVKPEEIRDAIRFEIEGTIPLPLEETLYDYEVIEPLQDHLDHIDLAVTAFPKTVINSYVGAIKNAGLKPYALELESHALLRACAFGRERASALVIDIGRTRTNLVIHSAGAAIFTSTIPFGGQLMEDALTKTLGITPDEACDLKVRVGLDRKERGGTIFSALVPSIAALADEAQRAIEYYQNHALHAHGADPFINRIVLAGGDANLNGLDTYLAAVLRVRVLRQDPFASFRTRMTQAVPPLSRHESLAFTHAFGLALKSYGYL